MTISSSADANLSRGIRRSFFCGDTTLLPLLLLSSRLRPSVFCWPAESTDEKEGEDRLALGGLDVSGNVGLGGEPKLLVSVNGLGETGGVPSGSTRAKLEAFPPGVGVVTNTIGVDRLLGESVNVPPRGFCLETPTGVFVWMGVNFWTSRVVCWMTVGSSWSECLYSRRFVSLCLRGSVRKCSTTSPPLYTGVSPPPPPGLFHRWCPWPRGVDSMVVS